MPELRNRFFTHAVLTALVGGFILLGSQAALACGCDEDWDYTGLDPVTAEAETNAPKPTDDG